MKENSENTKTEVVSIKFSKVEVEDFDQEAANSRTERSKVIRKYIDDGRSLKIIRAAVAAEIRKQIGLYGLIASDLFDLKESQDRATYRAFDDLWNEIQTYTKKSQVKDAVWRWRMHYKYYPAKEAKNGV